MRRGSLGVASRYRTGFPAYFLISVVSLSWLFRGLLSGSLALIEAFAMRGCDRPPGRPRHSAHGATVKSWMVRMRRSTCGEAPPDALYRTPTT